MMELDLPSWIQALAAIAVVVFTFQLVRVSRAQARATDIAAKAAEDSARAANASAAAAEQALHLNRPYVAIERVTVKHSLPDRGAAPNDLLASARHHLLADVRLKSIGAGPAIWTGFFCDIGVIPWRRRNPPAAYSEGEGMSAIDDVPLLPGQEVSTLDDEKIAASMSFSPDEWDELCDSALGRVIVRGRVQYRGPSEGLAYFTDFCWWYDPNAGTCQRAHSGNAMG